MVAPTWWHGPTGGNPRWENVDRPDLRIYIFIILVIRLSKVQQMAISFRFTRRSPWCLTIARHSWDSPFSSEMHGIVWKPRQQPPLSILLERLTTVIHTWQWRQQACPLTCRSFLSFLTSNRAPINWSWKPFQPRGWSDHGLLWEHKLQLYIHRNWIPCTFFGFCSIN